MFLFVFVCFCLPTFFNCAGKETIPKKKHVANLYGSTVTFSVPLVVSLEVAIHGEPLRAPFPLATIRLLARVDPKVGLQVAGPRSRELAPFPHAHERLFASVHAIVGFELARARSIVPTALPLARKRLLSRMFSGVNL
jgi:hypothetical protein